MNTAMQRIPQKYGAGSWLPLIAADNSRLVENSISPAITATEQVRSTIEAVVNQALEGQTGQLAKQANRLQFWIVLLGLTTVVFPPLVQIGWDWLRSPEEFRVAGPVRVDTTQPFGVQVSSTSPDSLRSFYGVALFNMPRSAETTSRTVAFSSGVQEVSFDIFLGSINPAVPLNVVLSKDGTIVQTFSMVPEAGQTGLRIFLRRPLVEPSGGSFVFQVSQDQTLREVPIRVQVR